MTHYRHGDIATRFKSWGYETDDIDAKIASMKPEQQSLTVLVAMMDTLDRCYLGIKAARSILKHQSVQQRDPIAGGMIKVWKQYALGRKIEGLDRSELRIRARKALNRGKFTHLSQITMESLLRLKNVGRTTANELLTWKAIQQKQPIHPPTSEIEIDGSQLEKTD